MQFVSDRTLYIVLSGRWCNIIVLKAHATTEEKSGALRDSSMSIEAGFRSFF